MSRPGHLDLESVERAQREAVEVARRMIVGDFGLIAGCRRLVRLSHIFVDDWCVDSDFVVFGAVESETDHLPLEDQRVHWDIAAYETKQQEVRHYEGEKRDQVLKACRSVIVRFGAPEPS